MNYLDKTHSIRYIDELLSKHERAEIRKKFEPIRPVHEPWEELNDGKSNSWSPPRSLSYTGFQSGGRHGPSSAVQTIASTTKCIGRIFLFIFPIAIFERICTMTEYYTYEEPVKYQDQEDSDGNVKKKEIFVCCGKNEIGATTRAISGKKGTFPITLGYVIAWFGILIINGTIQPGKSIKNFYRKMQYGIYYQPVTNAMTRDAFELMRRHIHFVDNRHQKKKGEHGYTPLFKVRQIMNDIMNNLQKAWIAGKHITVDESMIKYMGHAIAFVQYMPQKPIKHGIKVCCLCCAYTSYLLGFEVYVGKENQGTED